MGHIIEAGERTMPCTSLLFSDREGRLLVKVRLIF